MKPPIERAEAVTSALGKTKHTYCNNIFTHSFNSVKKRIKRILRSFVDDEISGSTPYHFQRISDIDGEQVNATLKESIVSIVDKHGGTAQLSAYLVPELRATLLDVEKKFGRRFIS